MKKFRIYVEVAVIICFSLITIGCEKYKEKPSYLLHVSSKECRLCGSGKNCLKSIYKNCTGIGILCLNDWRVVEVQTSNGSPVSDNGSSYIWEKKKAYSIKLTQIKSRRISLMHYKSDETNTPDMDKLKAILCRKCLKNIEEAVHIYGDHKDRTTKAVCLVEFPSMELYGIQQSFQYYFIGDYYAQAYCKANEIDLTVFLTPEM